MARQKLTTLSSGIFFRYRTSRQIVINSKKVGALNRTIQLGLIVYFVVFVLIRGKGYQDFDLAISGVVAKVKGVSVSKATGLGVDEPNWHEKEPGELSADERVRFYVWDEADYIIPPQQNAAFFVTTNLLVTTNQTRSRCPDSPEEKNSICQSNNDCRLGKITHHGHGRQTGRCVEVPEEANQQRRRTCEIYGWCPIERDEDLRSTQHFLMTNSPNYTVLLKNSIVFPKYGIRRRNILSWMDHEFLHNCFYNPRDSRLKYCPIFRLRDILQNAAHYNASIWRHGGMVSINIAWNCNLDLDIDRCVPEYAFQHLDNVDGPIAPGWNFRYANHYGEGGIAKRTLFKAYGIQFFVNVYGKAGQFDMITFAMNLGSLIGLLGVAKIVCDMLILYLLENRELYRRNKLKVIENPENSAQPASIMSQNKKIVKIKNENENYISSV